MRTDQRISTGRFGIGEIYGHPFAEVDQARRRQVIQDAREASSICPFHHQKSGAARKCNKKDGVCSLRLFEAVEDGLALPVPAPAGNLRVCCPNRFHEHNTVNRWIAETLLGTSEPIVVPEVNFLKPERGLTAGEADTDRTKEGVGRIDSVLVARGVSEMKWCAVEHQAVYFSGDAMGQEVVAAIENYDDRPHFPVGTRRPDYRSSGPKRLMPQLQIKVPTLRRWGKKMAVVVDESFFAALGRMDDIGEPSNADIAWFIVKFEFNNERWKLVPDRTCFVTLERAVEGLTAGRPVTLDEFESSIRSKLPASEAN